MCHDERAWAIEHSILLRYAVGRVFPLSSLQNDQSHCARLQFGICVVCSCESTLSSFPCIWPNNLANISSRLQKCSLKSNACKKNVLLSRLCPAWDGFQPISWMLALLGPCVELQIPLVLLDECFRSEHPHKFKRFTELKSCRILSWRVLQVLSFQLGWKVPWWKGF